MLRRLFTGVFGELNTTEELVYIILIFELFKTPIVRFRSLAALATIQSPNVRIARSFFGGTLHFAHNNLRYIFQSEFFVRTFIKSS